MTYTRGEVRTALAKAKDAGADCLHMRADDRETVITLEKWGFLPLDPVKVNAKVADWYVAQGLAVRTVETGVGGRATAQSRAKKSNDVSSHVADNDQPHPKGITDAAMSAAEAALTAAQAALAVARSATSSVA